MSSLGSPFGPFWGPTVVLNRGPIVVLFGIPSSPFSGSPLGSLWCPLWGLFGVPFGSSLGFPLGPFWGPLFPLFGVPSSPFLGSPLGPFWGPLWVLFGVLFGPFWGPLWVLFGIPSSPFLGSPWESPKRTSSPIPPPYGAALWGCGWRWEEKGKRNPTAPKPHSPKTPQPPHFPFIRGAGGGDLGFWVPLCALWGWMRWLWGGAVGWGCGAELWGGYRVAVEWVWGCRVPVGQL